MSLDISAACVAAYAANAHDCSAFARAVAGSLGITLAGNADAIVDTIRDDAHWTVLPNGVAAAEAAWRGQFVVAGMKGSEQLRPVAHGHVAVVVPGTCNRGLYPHAFWGSLGGAPGRNETINWAWTTEDRDHVTYAAYKPS